MFDHIINELPCSQEAAKKKKMKLCDFIGTCFFFCSVTASNGPNLSQSGEVETIPETALTSKVPLSALDKVCNGLVNHMKIF